ncbi:hypothetical protein C2S51_004844 [Perilla frutescens var. frutescens]|nr:hypothetical protein C2S51_004844 [Perilla frutescens var. frutescens]
MKAHIFLLQILLLQILRHAPSTQAVKYVAINDAKSYPGGARFEAEIGVPYTLNIMKQINNFIWDTLQQHNETDRKPVETVTVFIQQYDGAEAITYGEHINWNGEGTTPVGLVEGIADYMILVSNYYPPGFAKPGTGERWDQGYDFTARFLEYCEGLRSGFVADLNKMMRHRFSEDYFVKLMGKPVGQLWAEYKAKYQN